MYPPPVVHWGVPCTVKIKRERMNGVVVSLKEREHLHGVIRKCVGILREGNPLGPRSLEPQDLLTT